MTDDRVERRLAAVLAADVAGYSRLMGLDEEGTLARLKAARKALVDPAIASHRGRIVKTTGDGLLVEFASAVDAVRCAVEVQRRMAEPYAASVPQDQTIQFRIGIHVGDVIIDDNDIFGDGVNIAARLEGIAEPGGVCISDDAYRQVRGKVDVTCDDLGPQALKNIAETMRAWGVRFGDQGAVKARPKSSADQTPPLALPNKPSIAVLPFQNMSGDPEQEYFADGMVEEITTALSRNRSLFVIARNSSFTYKGKAVDIKQVGRELGVRYVLEGSVRKASGRVRITGQLIEAATGAHLWADKFDGTLDDIFDLQDGMTASVMGAIYPQLELAEIKRSQSKPTESMEAYDYYLRAVAELYKYTREGNHEIARLTGMAIQVDPGFSAAYAFAATSFAQRRAFGWIVDAVQEQADARQLALHALSLDEDNPFVLAAVGMVRSYALHEVEDGAALLSRSIALDPNLASARYWFGNTQNWLGHSDTAIDTFQTALRLSPLDPRRFLAQQGLSAAHFLAGRYSEALSWAKAATQLRPNFPFGHLHISASLAMLGRLDEARSVAALVTRLDPELTISNIGARIPYQRASDLEKLEQACRLAGLPE